MDTKTESRILLTALIAAPIGLSLFSVITGTYVVWGVIGLILGLAVLIWIWKPWHWFRKKA